MFKFEPSATVWLVHTGNPSLEWAVQNFCEPQNLWSRQLLHRGLSSHLLNVETEGKAFGLLKFEAITIF